MYHIIFTFCMNSYNGLAVTTSGINIVAIINAKAILIPFVVKRENPYAAIAQSTVLITSVRPTINTVFPLLIKSYVLDQKLIAFQCRMIRQIINRCFE